MAAIQTDEYQIGGRDDDAEESASGVDLHSSDLELTVDGDDNQIVAMRFNGVMLEPGTVISRAYVQFQVDETSSSATTLWIQGEASSNSLPIISSIGNISQRPRTTASVTWTPPSWSITGAAGYDQQTPDISGIIQEIIDQPDWVAGNSLAIIISGDGQGKRTAEAYDGDPLGAPLLHIEFGATPGNQAPLVDGGDDLFLMQPQDTACLQGTVSDDGIPTDSSISLNWLQESGPATALFQDPNEANTTVNFPQPGIYGFVLEANDGELTETDSVKVTVSRRIDVPADAPTIQAGVDLAGNGDIVIVAPGIYNENITVADKTITLASRYYLSGDPADIAATIIDGGGTDNSSAVFFNSGVGPETTIKGLTIRNVSNGIQTIAPINIVNNRITETIDGLQYDSQGGGLAYGNDLFGNIDDGIDINRHSNVVLEGNTIHLNGGDGVEIRMSHDDGPVEIVMRDNMLVNNDDDGIQLIDCDDYTQRRIVVENNVIAGNTEAGVGIMGDCETVENYEGWSALELVIITNNTFDGNDYGVTGGDNLTATNNIFMNQTNIAVKNIDGESSVAYNLFWNNGTNIVSSNVDSGSTLFGDPTLDGNYYPLPDSIVIDAGIDVGLPFNGSAPDLGAFETPVNTPPSVDTGEDILRSWSPDPIFLTGSATDDGLPYPPGALDITWTQIVGPCGVLIDNASAALTTATFAMPGRYRFSLSATDGEEVSTDMLNVELTADNLLNRPPVANDDSAGTQEQTAITVDVTANDTDPDGNLDSSAANTGCDTCSQPSSGALLNHGDGTFTYTPLAEFTGNDSFVYEVCDTDSLCDTATVMISVSAANTAPTVSITSPVDGASFEAGTAVAFTGSATDTEDGDAAVTATISWSSSLDGALGSGASVTTSGLSVGTHIITASVSDSDGLTASDTVSVTITAANTAPTVSIDSPANGANFEAGATVTFTGSATDTEDGDAAVTATISWSSSLDGALGSGASVTTSGLSVGTHSITASVSDSGGLTASDTISVTITAANTAPTVSIDSPANGANFEAGATVTFTGSATDTEDGDAAVTATISWSSSLDGALGSGASVTTSGLSVGTHSITASVIDSGGLTASDTISVTITAANTAPTVTITAPTNTNFEEGTAVSFSGSASDGEDGDLSASLSWTSNLDGPIGSGSSFITSTLSAGTHTITASVTDSGGLTASDTISVTITAANTAPTVTITAPTNTSFEEGTAVSFTGSASDDEDGDLTAGLSWTSDQDGPIGTGGSINISNLSVGTHSITASVTDSGGLTASDTISVTITAANT
ncbi:MAG: tandem-95 repeat protein, partial [Chromatiales bacterium]